VPILAKNKTPRARFAQIGYEPPNMRKATAFPARAREAGNARRMIDKYGRML